MGEWIQPRCLETDAPTIFCLPHAGSGAAGFFRWRRKVTSVNICPILLPGRDARLSEPPMADAAELVDALHTAIKPYLTRRYAIFGHSMGALIGALWTLRIQRDTEVLLPQQLILSGRSAPADVPAFPRLAELVDEELLAKLDARFGGDAAKALEDKEMRAIYMPMIRADLAVVDSALAPAFPEKIRVPVTVLHGADDAATQAPEGWKSFCSNAFQTVEMPGGHFFHFGESEDRVLATLSTLGW